MSHTLNFNYISETVVNYIDCVISFKADPEPIHVKLVSLPGIYIVLMTGLAIFLVVAGVKFKRMSLNVIFTFIIYSILKRYREQVDPIAQTINDALSKIEAIRNTTIFGEGDRHVLGYLVLSVFIVSALTFLMFWVRIAAFVLIIYIIYDLYNRHVSGPKADSIYIELFIIASITAIIVTLFGWIEDLLIALMISFLGCSILCAFVCGYFDFPVGYKEFYAQIFVGDTIGTIKNVNFFFLILPTIGVALAQKSLYCK